MALGLKIDKLDDHMIIWFLQLKTLLSKEIHTDMVKTLGEDFFSYTMVKKWVAEFQSLEDNPYPGYSIIVNTAEMTKKIHDIIMKDWYVFTLS